MQTTRPDLDYWQFDPDLSLMAAYLYDLSDHTFLPTPEWMEQYWGWVHEIFRHLNWEQFHRDIVKTPNYNGKQSA